MLFPEALLNSPMFGIGLTIIVYVFCELLVNRLELNIIPPFVLACPIIMGIIYFQAPHITYEQYASGASFINFLLGPATVALALPLYRNRKTLKANFFYHCQRRACRYHRWHHSHFYLRHSVRCQPASVALAGS
ncbi:MAG: LrgB family protein [Acidaminococcaceae bacterium]|nr:LrgB family protein [Acidaminococcaceae bacterium]